MRKTTLNIILGTNGTGKTTFLRRLIEENQTIGRRVLIVTPDDIEFSDVPEITEPEIYGFTGTKKLIYMPETLQNIYAQFHNGLLVFDDFKAFGITKQEDATTLRQIAIRRRQKMIDIAIAAHGFTEVVPYFLYTFSTHIVLFRTLDNISRVKAVLKDYPKMASLQQHVNQYAENLPHYFKIIKQ